MGRFSPTVLPDYRRDPGEDLARAFEEFEATRAAQRAEKAAARRTEIADILSGVRGGEIPTEESAPPPAPMAPRGLGVDLGSVLGDPRGAASLPRISLGDALQAPALQRPSEPMLGDVGRAPGLSLADAMRTMPQNGGGQAPGGMVLERGNLKPGSFDPVSGTFATSRGRPAEPRPIAPTGAPQAGAAGGVSRGTSDRYVPIQSGGYVDLQGSAGFARALADAESRRGIAQEQAEARAALAREAAESRAALARELAARKPPPTGQGPRNIDPLSPEGIAAATTRAQALLGVGGGVGAGRISEGERKNAAFFNQAVQANALLEGMDSPTKLDAIAASVPVVGRFGTSGEYQKLEQASLQLADAWLRATSGAAVPEQEVQRMARAFMPLASDKPDVKQQKADARKRILESLKLMAGNAIQGAAQQPSPPPPQQQSSATGGNTMTLKNGTVVPIRR